MKVSGPRAPVIVRTPGLAEHLAEVLQALGHPLRLRLVAVLASGERSVGELIEATDASPPIVSQQLRILRMARLVSADRQGGGARYRLREPGLVRLVACLEGCKGGEP